MIRQHPPDMFGVPVEPGSTVVVRQHTMSWGWVTAKGLVTYIEGLRANIVITEHPVAVEDGANAHLPKRLSPVASGLIVIAGPQTHMG